MAGGSLGWVAAPGLGCKTLRDEASESHHKFTKLQRLVALAYWYGGTEGGGWWGSTPRYLSPGHQRAKAAGRDLSALPLPCSRLTALLTQ